MTQPATRTYNPADLVPLDPSSLTWARTWVRHLLRQVPDDEGKWPDLGPLDAEIDAGLLVESVRLADGSRFYRPAFTAARMYLGNPEVMRTVSVGGANQTPRDAAEIVAAWLGQGRAFDVLAPTGTLLPLFDPTGATTGTTGPTNGRLRERGSDSLPLKVGGL